jgi:hypothetical protein
MLEALEIEVAQRLKSQPADHPGPITAVLEESLSNGLQITESKAYLAETFLAGLEDLIGLYVDSPRRERSQRRGGRAALLAAMRRHFEEAGVWNLMRKQIAAAPYTKPGDPLRIDCGYRSNGDLQMFQAISLETDADDAKGLAFSAPGLIEGVARVEQAKLKLTAIVEPLRKGESESENLSEERIAQYQFAVKIMEEGERIRVMTSSFLPGIAETARQELHV